MCCFMGFLLDVYTDAPFFRRVTGGGHRGAYFSMNPLYLHGFCGMYSLIASGDTTGRPAAGGFVHGGTDVCAFCLMWAQKAQRPDMM